MKGISGETGSLKLYAYGTDGTLKEVPTEKWHIQTEDGETPDTLTEDVLYEVHMTVEDGGDFDLSETEKEIKISAVLGIWRKTGKQPPVKTVVVYSLDGGR